MAEGTKVKGVGCGATVRFCWRITVVGDAGPVNMAVTVLEAVC